MKQPLDNFSAPTINVLTTLSRLGSGILADPELGELHVLRKPGVTDDLLRQVQENAREIMAFIAGEVG